MTSHVLAGVVAFLLATPPSGPEPVSKSEFSTVLKEIKAMPATIDRTAVVIEATQRRFITSDQSVQLLGAIPPGCGRLEAALHLHERLVDPENYYRVYKLFPDVSDQHELKKQTQQRTKRAHPRVEAPIPKEPALQKRKTATDKEVGFVKVDVVDNDGQRVDGARIYYCGKGPLGPPIDDSVRGEAWLTSGCELQVWIGNRMVYNEHFVPVDQKVFERRVRIDYY